LGLSCGKWERPQHPTSRPRDGGHPPGQ
jgi:hypothetical protein